MKNIVKIPRADREERIGFVFNYLYKVIGETSSCDGDVVWDFENTRFFHPFFIAPLSIYKALESERRNVRCENVSGLLHPYLNLIKFEDMLTLTDRTELQLALSMYQHRTYLPVCRFDLANKDIDIMQSIMQGTIEKQKNLDVRLKTPISYLLGELICNMQQHSKSKYGYMFSQYLSQKRSLYICLADTGITIYGNYANSRKYDEFLNENESNALRLAVTGKSTKNKQGLITRGFGISTNIDMITNGLKGGFFIMSGSAFYRNECGDEVYVDLSEPIQWGGTIILVRIPIDVPTDFNYLKYMIG